MSKPSLIFTLTSLLLPAYLLGSQTAQDNTFAIEPKKSSIQALSLADALEILESDNLEIKTAHHDISIAAKDRNIARGYNFGTLDFTQNFARSNDAGNVFGFKLSSREATFGDFGFNQFLEPMGQALLGANAGALTPADLASMNSILKIEPKDLNYPGYRNYHQSKLTYMLPIFTGGKLDAYGDISQKMLQMRELESEQLTTTKRYELRKSYYDMALVQSSIDNLTTIQGNINQLEKTTKAMIDEGYAKKVDLLEVEARKSNVERSLIELEANKKLLYHYISFLLNQEVDNITLPQDDYPLSEISENDISINNSDLKRASKGLEITDKMVDVAYAPYLPQVGAFAEVSSSDEKFMKNLNNHKSYTIGARLSWNLFNGGADYNELQKAKVQKLKTSTQLELAKKGILLQYDKIKTEIISLDSQVQSLQKELELSKQIYKNYEGRYQEHLVSMNDVIIKQSEQIEKVLKLQKVKNDRNERIFELEKLNNGVKK